MQPWNAHVNVLTVPVLVMYVEPTIEPFVAHNWICASLGAVMRPFSPPRRFTK